MAAWCERSQAWAAVFVQRESDGHGVADDVWFETEWERNEALRCWMPLPDLPNDPVSNSAGS